MIFNSFSEEGCTCAKCGDSQYAGVGMVARRNDGQRDVLTICEGCIFKSVLGVYEFERWMKNKNEPEPIPEPKAIKPRFFG